MKQFDIYLPFDRRHALKTNQPLPERNQGVLLFADISGFTALTEFLRIQFGEQRGAEEVTRCLNDVYTAIVEPVHQMHGSVVLFSGDAITCWFADDNGEQALTAAISMKYALEKLWKQTDLYYNGLKMKIAIVAGEVSRFIVGDPKIQRLDVLVGDLLNRVARGEHLAKRGEILVGEEIVASLGAQIKTAGWREDPNTNERFAILKRMPRTNPSQMWPEITSLSEEQVQEWILPEVWERVINRETEFVTEIRPAAILFLKFNGINYDQDPHSKDKLNQYICWVQHIVSRYGGHINQLIFGDKGSHLYIIFGAPISNDDDVLRSLFAARKLISPPPELRFINETKIGLSYGKLCAGAYGHPQRKTYTLLGDDVNIAARLMEHAVPNQICSHYHIYHLAKKSWQFETLPPIRIKGKAGLIRTYAALSQNGATEKESESAPKDKQLIFGREEEEITIATTLSEMFSGESKILLIEGDTGVGKSHLIAQFTRIVAEWGVVGLSGSGSSVEQISSYQIWREIFASYFGLDAVSNVKRREKEVKRLIHSFLPEKIAYLALLNPLLDTLFPETALTKTLSVTERTAQLFTLLTQLLQLWADEQPLVIVLEDAHWLDELSWDFTVELARTFFTNKQRFLLVISTRTLNQDSSAMRRIRKLWRLGVTRINLRRLSESALVAMTAHWLGISELPPDLANLIIQRSEGNPFFAKAIVETLKEAGAIRIIGSPPQLEMMQQLETTVAQLPKTVHGLILARIDRLSKEQKLLLKIASVIGNLFALSTLTFLIEKHTPHLIAELKKHLNMLDRLDLIELERTEPEISYKFTHVIVLDVVYQTLLFSQRKQLHLSLAGWYESIWHSTGVMVTPIEPGGHHQTPLLSLILHHYKQAEEEEKEIEYLHIALKEAQQYGDQQEIELCQKRLSLIQKQSASAPFL